MSFLKLGVGLSSSAGSLLLLSEVLQSPLLQAFPCIPLLPLFVLPSRGIGHLVCLDALMEDVVSFPLF